MRLRISQFLWIGCVSLFASLLVGAPLCAQTPELETSSGYSFADLGSPLSGYANSTASGVNNKGEVVGICYNDILLSQAFLWTNGVFSALSLPSHNVTRAGRINDNGDIIGVATITALQDGYYVNSGSTLVHWNRNFPNTQFNPIAWPAGHYKNSFDFAYPSGINQNNQAAGSTILNQSWGDFWSNGNQIVYAGDLDQQVPALWDNGVMTILAPADLQPWDLFYGRAHDINDNGTIVGTMSRYSFIDSSRNASFTFISQSGGPAEPLPGPFFYPFRINNAGDILCLSPEPDYLPSIYRNGTFIPLGTLDSGGGRLNPRSMNNSGQVVGDALNTVTGLYTAFLWQLDPVTGQSTIVDLNEAAAPEGWHLNAGNQITDSGVIVGSGTFDGKERAFMLTPAFVFTDYNRDGKIISDAIDKPTKNKPFRFWINDDDDSGEIGGSDVPNRPGLLADFNDGVDLEHVDGVRDLIDFFPVFIDLKDELQLTDLTRVEVVLKNEDSALSFVETKGLSPDMVRDYIVDPTIARRLGNASAKKITKDGVKITATHLDEIKAGHGIILVEGRNVSSAPLVVELWVDGKKLASDSLQIDISGVEQMFRHKNLLHAAGGPAAPTDPDHPLTDRLTSPKHFPDAETSNKYFVFVHGYNVFPDDARGSHAEFFKRMFWSGSRARFVGVTWHGAEQDFGFSVPHYHTNVINAFETSQELAAFINSLGGDVTLSAHSLGNLVVGSAIHDWNAKFSRYYMIDAAVPIESYADIETERKVSMRHPDWMRYADDRTWASEWHELFSFKKLGTDDNRHSLTWRNRLSKLGDNVYNFYSSTEDVLAEHRGKPSLTEGLFNGIGRFTWALQEKLKGRQEQLPPIGKLGSVYGGWLFNARHSDTGFPRDPIPPRRAARLSDQELREIPFFDDGRRVPGLAPFWLGDLYMPEDPDRQDIGSGVAAIPEYRNQLLAEMFPARTLPAGANFVEKFEKIEIGRNLDMSALFRNGWPSDRKKKTDWHHSDYRVVAYTYVHPLYKSFVQIGRLDQ